MAGNVHTVRHAAESGTWPLTALLVAAAVFVLSTLCATIRLVCAFRPRLPDLGSPNRFAFPSVARSGCHDEEIDPGSALAEADELAQALARIALSKHREVLRSLPWLVSAFSATLGWLALAGWFG